MKNNKIPLPQCTKDVCGIFFAKVARFLGGKKILILRYLDNGFQEAKI
jgi:hypothetical protein